LSKPFIHAKSSARRFGGKPEDYMDIHEYFDATKSALADVRHRAILHSTYGIYIVQDVFGQTRVNSEGKTYSVRDIGEQHVMEDLGFIPTLDKWFEGLEIKPWMTGKREVKQTTVIPFDAVPEAPSAPEAPSVMPAPAINADALKKLIESIPTVIPRPDPNPNDWRVHPLGWPAPATPQTSTPEKHPDFYKTITLD
jgi:hypothetical protein